jgi:hypothetical protein
MASLHRAIYVPMCISNDNTLNLCTQQQLQTQKTCESHVAYESCNHATGKHTGLPVINETSDLPADISTSGTGDLSIKTVKEVIAEVATEITKHHESTLNVLTAQIIAQNNEIDKISKKLTYFENTYLHPLKCNGLIQTSPTSMASIVAPPEPPTIPIPPPRTVQAAK